MRAQSAKAKGRRKQQEVAQRLRAALSLPETDIKSLPMGSQGVDIWMSKEALSKLPLSIEVKNQEALNIWSGLAQAETNKLDGTYPALVFSRNRSDTYIALSFDHFLELLSERQTETKELLQSK